MVDTVELKIGKVLKDIMTAQRHTLATISKTTGVPKSTIAEWLNNRTPNPVQAVKVANYLDVSLHYLLFGHNETEDVLTKILKEELFSGTFEVSIKKIKLTK